MRQSRWTRLNAYCDLLYRLSMTAMAHGDNARVLDLDIRLMAAEDALLK